MVFAPLYRVVSSRRLPAVARLPFWRIVDIPGHRIIKIDDASGGNLGDSAATALWGAGIAAMDKGLFSRHAQMPGLS
jgi:hypothetical protein